jgi:hypothetical protein
MMPIAAVLYLMLARSAAPEALLGGLALYAALCAGWNWSDSLCTAAVFRYRSAPLVASLRRGDEPLSVLAERYPDATGWAAIFGNEHLVGWWHHLRCAGVSVFQSVHATPNDPARRCLFLRPESGWLGGSLRSFPDGTAVESRTVMAIGDEGVTAVYPVDVPASGEYRLCCRWADPGHQGRCFAVAVDGGPPRSQPTPGGLKYIPCVLEEPLTLSAGKHFLTVTWPGVGARVDVIELTPVDCPTAAGGPRSSNSGLHP